MNMFNIQDFIKEIQSSKAAKGGIVINVINVDTNPVEDFFEDIFAEDEDATPPTDFEVGDRVMVCHIKKDGTSKHTDGTVTDILQSDEDGWYTRVTGDNGCHYKTGLVLDEERKGSKIIRKL